MSPRPRNKQSKSLMRNLGEFFGHIVEGVKSTPEGGSVPAKPSPADVQQPPAPQRLVREQVQVHEVDTPQGKVVLRRRIIDEVEPPGQAGEPGDGPDVRGQ